MKLMTLKLRKVGGACLLTLASAFGPHVLPATAQLPAPPAPATAAPAAPQQSREPIYSKSSTFNLPIQMEEATRQTLQKVILYSKTPLTPWTKQDETVPASRQFTFKAPQDGEYWFSLARPAGSCLPT
jgi:hypothetical protein